MFVSKVTDTVDEACKDCTWKTLAFEKECLLTNKQIIATRNKMTVDKVNLNPKIPLKCNPHKYVVDNMILQFDVRCMNREEGKKSSAD